MSPYPPFPVFTFVGFLIHTIAISAIGFRLLKRKGSRAVTFLMLGVFAYAIDFALITILFFLFENTIVKTHMFVFIASVLVPFGTLFLVLSVLNVDTRRSGYTWYVFVVVSLLIVYSYVGVLRDIKAQDILEYSFVHPAYPALITKTQGLGGAVASFITGFFFIYHALRSTLFVKRRAITIGIACLMLASSSFYWMSTTNFIYLFTHTIGPLGSILIAYGFFGFYPPQFQDQNKSSQSL